MKSAIAPIALLLLLGDGTFCAPCEGTGQKTVSAEESRIVGTPQYRSPSWLASALQKAVEAAYAEAARVEVITGFGHESEIDGAFAVLLGLLSVEAVADGLTDAFDKVDDGDLTWIPPSADAFYQFMADLHTNFPEFKTRPAGELVEFLGQQFLIGSYYKSDLERLDGHTLSTVLGRPLTVRVDKIRVNQVQNVRVDQGEVSGGETEDVVITTSIMIEFELKDASTSLDLTARIIAADQEMAQSPAHVLGSVLSTLVPHASADAALQW